MQCVVLRAGANLDRPPPRGNAAENRLDSAWQGGFVPALTDMARGAKVRIVAVNGTELKIEPAP